MLDTLPLELIINISSFLTLQDRLNLIYTCKKLHLYISNNTLFQEAVLNSYETKKTKAVFEKFQSQNLFSQQVKQLTIQSSRMTDDVFEKLALVFPNVTELTDVNYDYPGYEKSQAILDKVLPWKDNLQRLHINVMYSALTTLVHKNIFPKLTHLSISPNEQYNLAGHPTVNLLQCLSNVPSLTHLRLHNARVNIRFLEELHSRFPQLKSLTLAKLIINTERDPSSTSVEPTTQLLALQLEDTVIICDKYYLFLDYIVAKYRNLERLTFSGISEGRSENFDVYCRYVSDLENQYESDFDSEDERERTDIVDRNQMTIMILQEDYECTQRVYAMKGAETLSKLPSTLKELKVNTPIFKGLSGALNKANIRPKTLHINVSQSLAEIEPFQKWTCLTTLQITIPNDFYPQFGSLISDSVRTLSLYSSFKVPKQDIFLDRILASFPSLEKLCIHQPYSGQVFITTLCADKIDYLSETLYPKLRHLDVECSLLSPEVSDFLLYCVPNLKEMKLDLIANRISWATQREDQPSSPFHSIFLNDVKLDKLNIFVSYRLEDLSLTYNQKYHDDNQGLMRTKRGIYLVVQSDDQTDKYTLRKDAFRSYKDFSLANGIEVDDIDNRTQVLLSHSGTIKEIYFGENIVL